MRVSLFIPCYVDQFYPQVGVATVELLEKFGCQVDYAAEQTCCGQPMANAGYAALNHKLDGQNMNIFGKAEIVVGPSASCVLHLKEHVLQGRRVYELTEFLTDVLQIDDLPMTQHQVTGKIGIHHGCHGLRGLGLGSPSEMNVPSFSKIRYLLQLLPGIDLVELSRPDECCGFGGTFAVFEESVSVQMGKDKLADFVKAGANTIVSADMSCLMHLEGLIKRQRLPLRVMHIANLLNGH